MKYSILILITLALGAWSENAKAYCWKWKAKADHSDRYACFGPSQLSNSSYLELQDALFAVGCELASSGQSIEQVGKSKGLWVDCKTQLSEGEHSPSEIQTWVDTQGASKP